MFGFNNLSVSKKYTDKVTQQKTEMDIKLHYSDIKAIFCSNIQP